MSLRGGGPSGVAAVRSGDQKVVALADRARDALQALRAPTPSRSPAPTPRRHRPKPRSYKITGINDMTNPARESDPAYTGRFTTAAPMGAVPYGRRRVI